MFDLRRGLRAAALLLAAAALPAIAQTVPDDSPELRNFSLSPNLPELKEREPMIAPLERPPVPVQAPPVTATPPPQQQPAPQQTAPRQAPPRQVAPRSAPAPRTAAPAPTTTPPPPVPADEAVTQPVDTNIPLDTAPQLDAPIDVAAAPLEDAALADAPAESSSWMLWAGIGIALLGGIAFLLASRQRRRAERAKAEADALAAALKAEAQQARAEADGARAAALAAAREREEAEAQIRPWIEVEFTPASASATGERAQVEFELVVRNRGRSEAHNVRISGRMLNAGANQNAELAAFFGEPLTDEDGPTRTLAPGAEERFRSAFAFTGAEMRPIQVKDRSLLIPLVAFNVRYDWGVGRTGQTAVSYIVGRESDPPTDKMAPFRLDLGPRVYRQVGVRQHELKLVA